MVLSVRAQVKKIVRRAEIYIYSSVKKIRVTIFKEGDADNLWYERTYHNWIILKNQTVNSIY